MKDKEIGQQAGRIGCLYIDKQKAIDINKAENGHDVYAFVIITEGWLKMTFNKTKLKLCKNDMFVHFPKLGITVKETSPDYRAIALAVDTAYATTSSTFKQLLQTTYIPVKKLTAPKFTLSQESATMLCNRMRELIECLRSEHRYKEKKSFLLYVLFLLDLQHLQENAFHLKAISTQNEKLCADFIQLLSQHYMEQHNIKFYADQLNITPTYLSRVVSKTTGNTVMNFIDHKLLHEAQRMLKTTHLSVKEIASRMQFTDASSFTRFYKRMSGITPKEFRYS